MSEAAHLTAEKEKKYLFSVIVPVYKTEEYVAETIESVLNQTIGFTHNIQLILVNNATPDGAGEICKKYRDIYPDNIVYVELLENRGPSGARNAGIPYVKGKYVNFLDSDDKWAKDAFEKVYAFFERHKDIECAICRRHYFEAWDSWFYDDRYFTQTRVCDLFSDADFSQFWIGPVFFHYSLFDMVRWDEQALYSEDTKLLNEILLRTEKYGAVREAVFYYRKRASENLSQVGMQRKSRYWYFDSLDRSYLYLVERSKQMYGAVIPYIQFVLMQEVEWRITQKDFPPEMGPADMRQYREKLREVLENIDDAVIMRQPKLWKEYKIACLQIKYGRDIEKDVELRKGALYFRNLNICSLTDKSILTIVEHHVEGENLVLDGKINMPFSPERYKVVAVDDLEREYPVEDYPGDESNVRCALGEPCLVKRCFRVSVPLAGVQEIRFLIRWGEIERELYLNFGKFAHLTTQLSTTYCVEKRYLFTTAGYAIRVEMADSGKDRVHEQALRWELVRRRCKRALFLRAAQPLLKKSLKGKQLWLFADRMTKAGDNAEYLFRYLKEHPQPGVQAVFAVSKDSPDYRRMKQYGKVIPIESVRYQLYHLAADVMLSSLWGRALDDPFGWHRDFVRDLDRKRYVYLDHALTKDDISSEVNKHARNFAMWTTGADAETDSILRYPYGYGESVPRTTGLARYDAIYPAIDTKKEKRVLFAPTWRKGLAVAFDENGMVRYSEAFKESEFFDFYNRLINDERILTAMRDKGYTGILKLHPTIQKQEKDFKTNNVIGLYRQGEAYEKEFFDTSLVVTDYSSIAMDFGFVKCPVIYAQFDKEEFYRTHSYHESYFDYEKDGFGPVCYDYESTVQALLCMLARDCVMEREYEARREAFFAHLDDHNCERIIKEVLGIDERV